MFVWSVSLKRVSRSRSPKKLFKTTKKEEDVALPFHETTLGRIVLVYLSHLRVAVRLF